MKKTTLAIALASLTMASVHAAPANSFYTGVRVGWASAHYDVNQFKNQGIEVKRNQTTYGAYMGYQMAKYFGMELGYDNFGGFKVEGADGRFKTRHHGPSLSLKPSIPLASTLDAYLRVGAALVRSDVIYDDNANNEHHHIHNWRVSPVYAAGFEYNPSNHVSVRLEYAWIDQMGRFKDSDTGEKFNPRSGGVTLGLAYRFGGETPAPAPVPVPVEPAVKEFTLNSDVTFNFGKADLKPEARTALTDIYSQIKGSNAEHINVAGYTDRIGSKKYNQRLSQQRADAVAQFFVSQGFNAANITSTGYGPADPVVDCNDVRGRKALIKCLAPNRRVDIKVTGTTTEAQAPAEAPATPATETK